MTVDTQLASRHAGTLYLVEMQFSTGTYRFTNWTHSVEWPTGTVWLGFGAIVDVGGMSQAERLEYPSMDIGLQIGDPAMLALALGNASTYRNRPVTVWAGILDDELRAVDDPLPYWAGVMDQVRLATGDGEGEGGSVVMRCENPCRDSRAPRNLRLNNAQQQARFPGDTGLSRIERMTGVPQLWMSVRYQRGG